MISEKELKDLVEDRDNAWGKIAKLEEEAQFLLSTQIPEDITKMDIVNRFNEILKEKSDNSDSLRKDE